MTDMDKPLPFAHSVHVRVSRENQARVELAIDLRVLLKRANDFVDGRRALPQPAYAAWMEATTNLLTALGEKWDEARQEYVIR